MKNLARFWILIFAVGVLFMVTISCMVASPLLGGSATATPIGFLEATPIQVQTATLEATQVSNPTLIPPTENLAPTPTELLPTTAPAETNQPCTQDFCIYDGYFLLERPIGSEGRNTIDYSYRFGIYDSQLKDVNRGVDFLNSSGTPVLAAWDGEVVVAGDDQKTLYGPLRNFYGNLVIIEHQLPGISQSVFTLYAHLSQVSVKVKDQVKAGDEIGLVGMTGAVPGSTLHFEVRMGENSYATARNPELWLTPLPDEADQPQGAMAGRILDPDGNFLQVPNIVVERLSGPGLPAMDRFYLRTYAEKRLSGQPPWEENFAAGDLPAGQYKISFLYNGMQQQVVEIQPGKITVVNFMVK